MLAVLSRLIPVASAALFALGAQGCQAAVPPEERVAACELNGFITESSVSKAMHDHDEFGCDEIVITSNGGDVGAALMLVDFIDRNRVTLRARRHCHSSCAQVVAVLADDLVVDPDTLFIMHSGAVAGSAWLGRNTDFASPSRDEIINLGNEVVRRLEEQGGDAQLLYEPVLRSRPICVLPEPTELGEPVIATNLTGWMPSRVWLEKARGLPFKGYWLEGTNESFGRVFEEATGDVPGLINATFGGPIIGEDHLIEDYDPMARLGSIPVCPADVARQLQELASRQQKAR